MRVDLPEPDGPITATKRPLGTSSVTPRSASTAASPVAVAAMKVDGRDGRTVMGGAVPKMLSMCSSGWAAVMRGDSQRGRRRVVCRRANLGPPGGRIQSPSMLAGVTRGMTAPPRRADALRRARLYGSLVAGRLENWIVRDADHILCARGSRSSPRRSSLAREQPREPRGRVPSPVAVFCAALAPGQRGTPSPRSSHALGDARRAHAARQSRRRPSGFLLIPFVGTIFTWALRRRRATSADAAAAHRRTSAAIIKDAGQPGPGRGLEPVLGAARLRRRAGDGRTHRALAPAGSTSGSSARPRARAKPRGARTRGAACDAHEHRAGAARRDRPRGQRDGRPGAGGEPRRRARPSRRVPPRSRRSRPPAARR